MASPTKATDSIGRKRFPFVLLTLSAVAVFVLVSLGNWQVRRLAWKEDLLAKIEVRISADPVSVDEVMGRLRAGEDIEYLPVSLSGTFRHEGEQHVLATWKGVSGWNIYTPLQIGPGEQVVVVNRGFVPFDRKDPDTRPESQPEAVQEIAGLARSPLAAKPSWVVPNNAPAKNEYYWKDLAAMATAADLSAETVLPIFVDAGPGPDPRALPVGGVTHVDLPNNHLQYAATWYGLAGALVLVLGVFLWRRRR